MTMADGAEKKLRYDEIIHIKMNPTEDGTVGVSPLTYARLTTSVGIKQEEFQESFYDHGGRPDGVLKTTADLSSREVVVTGTDGKEKKISLKDEMRAAWANAHAGTNNRFNVAVLDNGLEYVAIPQISPADMDFVNSKTSNIEDICRYFNVPTYKLGVGKQTYSNNEQANIEYITNTIVPLVTQIEQEFTIKLLPNADIESGIVIKCNIEAELRGDSASRAAWYKNMQLIGANSTPLDVAIKGGSVPSNFTSGDNKKVEENNGTGGEDE